MEYANVYIKLIISSKHVYDSVFVRFLTFFQNGCHQRNDCILSNAQDAVVFFLKVTKGE